MRLDPDILDCLETVMDPEVGISIVHLGLVYRAERVGNGIAVALTLTTRSCPIGEFIVEEARQQLATRFQDCDIDVGLVWDPPWTPELITERGLKLLGHPAAELH